MSIVDVLVPQMGEGLQEVLVVELLKKPGDRVRRDEPLYSMETDKATLDVESPEEGVLTEWLAGEGDALTIGAPICRIDTGESTAPIATASSATDLRSIPPRTRAYARELGVSDTDLVRIPAASGRLMPEDIDAFRVSESSESAPLDSNYVERPLSPQDRTFLFRLKRSAEQVIPAVAKRQVSWDVVRAVADRLKTTPDSPSAFTCIAYAVARAVADNPKFRSTLIREEFVREYPHVQLGIAVSLPTGELTVARVPDADALAFSEFVRISKAQIASARTGNDQADETTSLVLTYLGHYEIIDAVPVLVAPAVGVLFIGSPYRQEGAQVSNLVLTFDHRMIHGVEAAKFLKAVAENVAGLEELVGAV